MNFTNDIREEIARQAQDAFVYNFSCKTCMNYKGRCCCEKNVFIAFEGANMSGCANYIEGKKCQHCGRIT